MTQESTQKVSSGRSNLEENPIGCGAIRRYGPTMKRGGGGGGGGGGAQKKKKKKKILHGVGGGGGVLPGVWVF